MKLEEFTELPSWKQKSLKVKAKLW